MRRASVRSQLSFACERNGALWGYGGSQQLEKGSPASLWKVIQLLLAGAKAKIVMPLLQTGVLSSQSRGWRFPLLRLLKRPSPLLSAAFVICSIFLWHVGVFVASGEEVTDSATSQLLLPSPSALLPEGTVTAAKNVARCPVIGPIAGGLAYTVAE